MIDAEQDIRLAEQLLQEGATSLGLSLTGDQFRQFRRYFHELISWNEKANLTALASADDVYLKHFLDSLTLSLALPDGTPNLLDVGSGAGFPGVPLAIAADGLQVTLVEATGKKTKFLEHLIPTLGLSNVPVVQGRAEEQAHLAVHREQYGCVVSRAVARMATLAEYLLPFCRVGGITIAMKQGNIEGELAEAGQAVEVLGGRFEAVQRIDGRLLPEGRQLVVLRKIAPTPDRYPRRSGMPAKRPL